MNTYFESYKKLVIILVILASAKTPEREGSIYASMHSMHSMHLCYLQLLWATARLLATRVSLIYLVDKFFFMFLV